MTIDLAELAEMARRFDDLRRATIHAELAIVSTSRDPNRRYASYWHARLLIAEDRSEALYVTEAEWAGLRGVYPPEPTKAATWDACGVAVPFNYRPVVVDDALAQPAVTRAGEPPAPPRGDNR